MHKLAFDVEEMNEEQQKAEHTDGKAFSMIVIFGALFICFCFI